MAPDSEGKDPFEEQEAERRKEYLENPAGWLQDRFTLAFEEIRDQSIESGEWQKDQMKIFMQDAAELHSKNLRALETSSIVWLGIIAIIALTLSGFWLGAAGVLLAIGYAYWRRWLVEKNTSHFSSFRDKFRYLLKEADDMWPGRMLAEDKSFLQKCKDSVLFPLAIAPHRRKEVSLSDIWDIETLYVEYHGYTAHSGHRSVSSSEDCKLCASARLVREHIEGVLAKFEAGVESVRQLLVTQIDGNNKEGAVRTEGFQMLFRWWEESFPGEFPHWRHERNFQEDCWRHDERCRRRNYSEDKRGVSLESLRDKERWTFNEADAVRELHLAGWEGYRATNENDDEFDRRLTSEMKSAAELSGLKEQWKWYDEQTQSLWGSQSTFMAVRRAIGRQEPQAMFRELCGRHGPFVFDGRLHFKVLSFLENFTNYGYDSKVIGREIKSAYKLIVKEGGWK